MKTSFCKKVGFLFLASLILILPYPAKVKAADVVNITVSFRPDGDRVYYSVNLIHTGGATDNISSQLIDMTGLDTETGVIQVWGLTVTGRDVNLFIEGSNSRKDSTFASFYTRPELDDVDAGGTAPILLNLSLIEKLVVDTGDTSRYVIPEAALKCRYLRITGDGQSGNPAGSTTHVRLTFKKTVPWVNRDFGVVNSN